MGAGWRAGVEAHLHLYPVDVCLTIRAARGLTHDSAAVVPPGWVGVKMRVSERGEGEGEAVGTG